MTRPVHALAASSPEIAEKAFSLSGGPVDRLGPTTLSMGGIAFDTWVAGGGDCNTGTAGICKGDLVKVVHSSASLHVILGDVLGTFGSSDLVDVGLPIPGKEHLIALPLSPLEELTFIVLANSFLVPLGGSCILPLGKYRLEWVGCVACILNEWGLFIWKID